MVKKVQKKGFRLRKIPIGVIFVKIFPGPKNITPPFHFQRKPSMPTTPMRPWGLLTG
jgi:hypothetical protein